MNIHTLQTGRAYTAAGQRIAYTELLHCTDGTTVVGFVDVDRMIDNVLLVAGMVTDANVLQAYDECAYARRFWLTAEVKDALITAARALPPLS
jgi:hypothetical protein